MTFWNFKKDPSKDIESLGEQLKSALGPRLKALICFGSVARGEYDPKRSNVNVLVVADLSPDGLKTMSPVIRAWIQKGYTPPVLVAPEDLDDFARDFSVEFLDIKAHSRVVRGEDVLASLQVDTKHLESQVEHDLAVIQLGLRQSVIAGTGKGGRPQRVLEKACNSVGVLLQAAQRFEKENASAIDKMQALKKVNEIRRTLDRPEEATGRLLDLIASLLTELRSR